jgi:hypothetical protein
LEISRTRVAPGCRRFHSRFEFATGSLDPGIGELAIEAVAGFPNLNRRK